MTNVITCKLAIVRALLLKKQCPIASELLLRTCRIVKEGGVLADCRRKIQEIEYTLPRLFLPDIE